MVTRATEASFWARVDRSASCWLWTGAQFRGGYGRVKFRGRDTVAHRIAFELAGGTVPAGLQLDHLCRNRLCVRPRHLQAVTPRENVLRSTAITAANAAKTACLRGHPLSGDNLFVRADGRRRCRACERASQRRLRHTAAFRARHAAYERARRRLAA